MAEGEEETAGQRALAVGHQLAGGVVDARDVVGVEGVPEPEEPRGYRHAEPDPQARAAVRSFVDEVVRHDAQHVNAPPRGVDRENETEHREQAAPLTAAEVSPDPAQTRPG